MALRLYLCLSDKSEFYRNGRTNRAGFGMGTSFHLSYSVLKGNSGIPQNNGTFLWNFIVNSEKILLRQSAYRSSKRVIDLARQRWTLRA